MLERKKYCPVCGELAAVLDGDADKYGEKAVGYYAFIRVKYCCDECRDIIKTDNVQFALLIRRLNDMARIMESVTDSE